MKNIFFYQTPIGRIGILEDGHAITNLYFPGDQLPAVAIDATMETELLSYAGAQLQSYFEGRLKFFNLPLAPVGTKFRQQVWESVRKVSYGETRSYQEIAISIDNNNAYRAVGLANSLNPIPIFIPCHRIIGANGRLVGYRGGLQVKKYLLKLEKTAFL